MTERAVAEAVTTGLWAANKTLPSWLLYDAAGCELYEQITTLPEYYLTRAEAEIFTDQGDALIQAVSGEAAEIAVAEIGAGMATKTERLLEAVLRRQAHCTYLACDIATTALAAAATRLTRNLPRLQVKTASGSHVDAGPAIATLTGRQMLLFIGSSLGNYRDTEAIRLLASMRTFLRPDAVLVLGTDVKKDASVLLPAYDDAQGVTSRFSLNILSRLNRDLGANFELSAFRHVALWDEPRSNIEIFIESKREQTVQFKALEKSVSFAAGERIHTETSAKYNSNRIKNILQHAGFSWQQTLSDSKGLFAVHLAGLS